MLSANFVARATVSFVHVVIQMQCYAPQCCCKTAGILCTMHCGVLPLTTEVPTEVRRKRLALLVLVLCIMVLESMDDSRTG